MRWVCVHGPSFVRNEKEALGGKPEKILVVAQGPGAPSGLS